MADRLTWLDALRLTAGLSMVALHASADANGQPFPDAPAGERIAPMILRAFLYVARTELFIIISLFLLVMALDRRPRSYATVISQQARRLLVPFLFWTLFYAAYGLIKAQAFGYADAHLARLADPMAWLGILSLGEVKYHMHFIPTLFGIVLFFPLFLTASRFLWVGLLILVLLALKRELDGFIYAELWGTDLLPYAVRGLKILTYCGYGLAAASLYGMWKRSSAEVRSNFVGLILLAGGLLFAVKLVAAARVIETGRWAFDYTPGYWADFLMPVVLFALCMCLAHLRWPGVLSRLAPYSFGIYLCHPIFLDLAEVWLRDSALTPFHLILAKIAIVLPTTSLFVWALSRLTWLAWTIGLGPLPRLLRHPFSRAHGRGLS